MLRRPSWNQAAHARKLQMSNFWGKKRLCTSRRRSPLAKRRPGAAGGRLATALSAQEALKKAVNQNGTIGAALWNMQAPGCSIACWQGAGAKAPQAAATLAHAAFQRNEHRQRLGVQFCGD